MKKFAFLISFFSCLLLSSCNSLNDEVVVVPNPEEPSEPDEPTNPDTPVEEDLYEEMYDPTSNLQITLNFTNEAIYKLAKYSSDEVKKEMYHPCDVTISLNDEVYTFKEVGARMKGNSSRNDNFVSEDGYFNAPVHFKLSFKETFDDVKDNDYYIRSWEDDALREERKDRTFADQQKLDMKYNKEEDQTFTRQIYAYNAFNEEGLMASKVTLAKVTINSENDSMTNIYQIQETIDKDFLKKRLPKEEYKGNLYKATYTDQGPASLNKNTIDKIGVEGPNYHPSYDLKTNDKEDEIDHSLLRNVINTLNDDTRSASSFKDTLDSLIDVDSILKYQALCWVIGNPDDSRNNSNNFYIYFNSKTNKMSFIPYDFDRCFGILKDWEIHMENIPLDYNKQYLGNGNEPYQPNPLLWRLFLSENDNNVDYSNKYPVIEEYQTRYISLCKEYASKYLDNNKFINFSNQFVYSSQNSSNSVNLTFEEYATSKLSTLN